MIATTTESVTDRVARERAAQGLPESITDPSVLSFIARCIATEATPQK